MAEAFVYCWSNDNNKKLYVGYHKGSTDDGYICSSNSEEFWNDFNNPKIKWSRQIIAEGTTEDCIVLEKNILQSLNLNEHYNNSAGGSIVFTKEVRKKMSESMKGKNTFRCPDAAKKQSVSLTQYHQTLDEKTKKSIYKKVSDTLKGRNASEESKRKMSEAKKGKPTWNKGITMPTVVCPSCGKEGSVNNMKRWHFDNCRNN